MPRRKTSKIKEVRQDKNGRFFRNLGNVRSTVGKYSQRKFYLGYDEDHARLAAVRLEALWDVINKRHKNAAADATAGLIYSDPNQDFNKDVETYRDEQGDFQIRFVTGKPIWTDFTLVLAEAIREGELTAVVPMDVVQELPEFCTYGTPEDNRSISNFKLMPWLEGTRRQYPMIHIEIADREAGQEVDAMLQSRGQSLIEAGHRLTSEPLTHQKLHIAIGAYKSHVKKTTIDETGETTEWGKAKVRQINFVKQHVPDVDLAQLGAGSIEAFLNLLAARPNTKRGNTSSVSFIKSVFKELKVFLNWLEKSKEYAWQWPDGFEFQRPRIAKTTDQSTPVNVSRRRRIEVFNVDEVSTLYQYASPIQRTYMLLGLNCGMANAEITTLLQEDIFLKQPHPDEDFFRFDCGSENSWITRIRTKSDVLCTWKLWPETVLGIE